MGEEWPAANIPLRYDSPAVDNAIKIEGGSAADNPLRRYIGNALDNPERKEVLQQKNVIIIRFFSRQSYGEDRSYNRHSSQSGSSCSKPIKEGSLPADDPMRKGGPPAGR